MGFFKYSEALRAIIREIYGHFGVVTLFDLKAGVQGKIQDSRAMTSCKLFSHSKPLGAMVKKTQDPFNRITPFDINYVISQPFCF